MSEISPIFRQNFAKFLEFSMNLDIFEHVREIPTKFHRNLDKKNNIFHEKSEIPIENSIFNLAKLWLIFS